MISVSLFTLILAWVRMGSLGRHSPFQISRRLAWLLHQLKEDAHSDNIHTQQMMLSVSASRLGRIIDSGRNSVTVGDSRGRLGSSLQRIAARELCDIYINQIALVPFFSPVNTPFTPLTLPFCDFRNACALSAAVDLGVTQVCQLIAIPGKRCHASLRLHCASQRVAFPSKDIVCMMSIPRTNIKHSQTSRGLASENRNDGTYGSPILHTRG